MIISPGHSGWSCSMNTDHYEVDVEEYIKTGIPVQRLPTDKRRYDV